ncbi:MAG: hypothetical protein FGM54_04925 [Chitinophagaceae bacterium]|nr:hypothetical protein [Chitinophagaceae bacterium]
MLFLLLLYVGFNLSQPYLWYDEAVQFWIGKGLNPDSPSFSPTGNLVDVFNNNRYYNLDPGGFGFLLYVWSAFSNQVFWLRILPYLFFVFSVFTCIYSAWLLTRNSAWALLAGFIPFLIPNAMHLSVELRAYSMEVLCSLCCIAGLLHLEQKLSAKRLLACSCLFCFLITSRYTALIMVGIASLYVLYIIFNQTISVQTKWRYSIVYALPLLLMVLGIYGWVLRIQNADINPLYYLPYLSKKKHMLWQSSFWLFNGICLLHAFLFLASYRFSTLKPLRPLFFMAAASNTGLIILSYAGMHPWGPYSFRCISLPAIQTTCSVLALIAWLKTKQGIKYRALIVVSACAITANAFWQHPKILKRFYDQQNAYYVFKKKLVSPNMKIYADYFEAPYIKYLFEYGDGKTWATPKYPDQFYLAICTRHGFTQGNQSPYFDYLKTQPVMNDLMNYDCLLTPQLFRKGQHDAWALLPGANGVWIKKAE